jgi:hypothetical protein
MERGGLLGVAELKEAFEQAEVPEMLEELSTESEDRELQLKADEMLEKWFPGFRGGDDYGRDEDDGVLAGDEGDAAHPRAAFGAGGGGGGGPSPALFPAASGMFGAGDPAVMGAGGGFGAPAQDAAGHFRFDAGAGLQPAAAAAAAAQQQGWGGAAAAGPFAPPGAAPAPAPFTFSFSQS